MFICVIVFIYQSILERETTKLERIAFTERMELRVFSETLGNAFLDRYGVIPSALVKGRYDRDYIGPGLSTATLPGHYESRVIRIETEKGIEAVRIVTVHRDVTTFERFLPLLTALFLHGSLFHLLGNLLFLYIFGNNIEERLGHFKFLCFYLVGGVLASLAHVITGPSSQIPVIGASGAISAILGAYFLLFPRSMIVTLLPLLFFWPIVRIPAFIFLGFWFFTQLTNGFGSLASASQGVAWWAHVGGFAFGLALAFYNYPKWRSKRPRHGPAKAVSQRDARQ